MFLVTDALSRLGTHWQIVTAELSFTPAFSPTARDLLRQLLTKSPARRLGIRGVRDIQQHAFFASIDWGKLERRECTPPYKPSISSTEEENPSSSSQQPPPKLPLFGGAHNDGGSSWGVSRHRGSPPWRPFLGTSWAHIERLSCC